MNKRIKELALKSGMLNYIDGETPRHYFISDNADEKCLNEFAQMIVQECIDLMNQENKYYSDPGSYQSQEYYDRMNAKADAFDDAANIIRYHFKDN